MIWAKIRAVQLVAKAKALGFEGVQLVIKKALIEDLDVSKKPTLSRRVRGFSHLHARQLFQSRASGCVSRF
ncbi:MAG: hypothetical protein MZU97_26370 [Bacillus subtilis]|nr:hypothetical protein [Bacillus subtilis]